jgi:hypothetical protein
MYFYFLCNVFLLLTEQNIYWLVGLNDGNRTRDSTAYFEVSVMEAELEGGFRLLQEWNQLVLNPGFCKGTSGNLNVARKVHGPNN